MEGSGQQQDSAAGSRSRGFRNWKNKEDIRGTLRGEFFPISKIECCRDDLLILAIYQIFTAQSFKSQIINCGNDETRFSFKGRTFISLNFFTLIYITYFFFFFLLIQMSQNIYAFYSSQQSREYSLVNFDIFFGWQYHFFLLF